MSRRTIMINYETYVLIEAIQRKLKRLGFRHSKSYVVDLSVRLLHRFLFEGDSEKVMEFISDVIGGGEQQ